MRRTVTIVLALLAVACVEEEPEPEVCEPDWTYAYEPGTQWAPCREDGTCDSGNMCANDLGPIQTDVPGEYIAADICVRSICTPTEFPTPWVDNPWCGPLVENTDPLSGPLLSGCHVECWDDTGCANGMICHYSRCFWPKPYEE